MKNKIFFIGILICLCLCACSTGDTVSGNSETMRSSSQTEEDDEKTSFEKIKIGAANIQLEFSEYQYGVFALDTDGNLYFGNEDSNSMVLVDTEVKDFDYDDEAGTLYVLKKNGDLLSSQDSREYRVGQPLSLFCHNDSAEKISYPLLMLSDGSVLRYRWETDAWNSLDITAKKIDEAALIDDNDTLWYLDYSAEALQKIAENVIDCSYSARNKVYYSSDIWYVTSDHTLHIYQTKEPESEISAFPENIVAVAGDMGHYLVQQEDGTLLYGSLTDPATELLGIRGQGHSMDFFGFYFCTYIDEKGKIHLDRRELGTYEFFVSQ